VPMVLKCVTWILPWLFFLRNKVAKEMNKAFSPDKINYASFGDTSGHIHFHLIPKYKNQFEWTETFELNPKKIFLADAEYVDMIELIKKNL